MNSRKIAEQAGFVFGDTYWTESDLTPLLERLVELVAAHEREECIQNVLQQYEGFGTEHQGVEYVKQRIVEAIRARSKHETRPR